jgi:hypothetical protein
MWRLRSWLVLAALLAPVSGRADEVERRLERHKEAAHAAFELGRYDVAITEFQAAYSIRRDSRLLYNIGLAHVMRFRLRAEHVDLVQARDLFTRFLLLAPTSGLPEEQARIRKMRQLAQRYLEEAERRLAVSLRHPESQPGPALSSVVAPTPPAGARPHAPWILYGLSAAAGVGVAVTGGLALDAQAQAKDLNAHGNSSATNAMADRADRLALAADVLIGVAVVSAVIGLVLHYRSVRERHRARVTVARGGPVFELRP